MDLFLMHGETDDLSLQDMIARDMKEEFEATLHDEFTGEFSLNNLDSDITMNNFEPLFDDLQGVGGSLEDALDVPMTPATNSSTHSSVCSSSSSMDDPESIMGLVDHHGLAEIAWLGSSSHKDSTFDLESTIFVDPSSVLPSTLPSSRNSQVSSVVSTNGSSPLLSSPSSPSPMLSSSPASLSSSSTITSINNSYSTSSLGQFGQTLYIKSDAIPTSLNTVSAVQSSTNGTQVTVVRPIVSTPNATLPLLTSTTTQRQQQPSAQQHHRVQISSNSILNGTNRPHTIVGGQQQQHARSTSNGTVTSSHTTTGGHVFRAGKPNSVRNGSAVRRADERALPKPAYSYSCLIALALKNSTTGSLPVSEIYSFMCEYFPYFRTAPNGWKNSVRHNLSLNKCFEKIEKPVVSGNNQRKGCLWALNPNKVHKMDEEIQKWSKKDLQGIKDAMSTPEVLSALERGEMKFEATSSTSSCSEDEEEDEEVDPLSLTAEPANNTLATLKFVNGQLAPRTTHVANRVTNPGQQTRNGQLLTQQQQQSRTTLQIHTTTKPSTQQSNSTTSTTTILRQNNNGNLITTNKIRAANNGAIFQDGGTAEFILPPDSTMTEISLPTAGKILDDLGNEIGLDDEDELVTSSTNNVSVLNSTPTRSLVLRKLPVTPVRSSVRTNYLYSPSIASPHQQHSMNRLVLTNAKIA